MKDNPELELYIKRVLREIIRSDDDAYIDTKIKKEILARVAQLTSGDSSDEAVGRALKELGPPSILGKSYKKEYKFSAQRISGLLLFNRFFVNISASVLILVAAFAVFRMFPQTEYVAYLVCALSGVAAGIIAHSRFYKAAYMATTAVLPSFLLIYYPFKAALGASFYSGEPFLKTFFSYDNHIVFMIILSSVLFFAATAFFLHVNAYIKRPKKLYIQAVCVFTVFSFVAGFGVYALDLKVRYDEQAAALLGGIGEAYGQYIESCVMPETLLNLGNEARELAKRYGAIYIPPNKLITSSLYELFVIFDIYDSGYENLVLYFHASYNPKKETPFDAAALSVVLDGAREKAGAILSSNTGEPNLKTLLNALSECDTLRFEVISSLGVLFKNWAYSTP